MAEFQNPFFTSSSEGVETEYVAGVIALQGSDYHAASRHFANAAQGGHVSALFNLSLLWGGGSVTPYDFDLAAARAVMSGCAQLLSWAVPLIVLLLVGSGIRAHEPPSRPY